MRKLDLKEFYQEPNIVVSKNGDYSFGATGLITLEQFIAIHNLPALDEFGKLVEGLGYHYDTMDAIICTIFNHPLPSDVKKLEEFASEVLTDTHKNYIKIHFINEKENGEVSKLAYIFIPAYISFRQYDYLRQLDEELRKLNFEGMNIEVGACVTNYNPTSGKEIQNLRTNCNDIVPLGDMLNYMMAKRLVVPNEKIFILNAKREETILSSYLYGKDSEDFSRKRAITNKTSSETEEK